MTAVRCSCPKVMKDGHLVRAALDARCPAHGQKPAPSFAHRVHQNCPSCTCREPDPRTLLDEE